MCLYTIVKEQPRFVNYSIVIYTKIRAFLTSDKRVMGHSVPGLSANFLADLGSSLRIPVLFDV